MNDLFKGAMKFYEEDYIKHKKFYENLRENKPKTLFITCVDSRIDPNRLTKSNPGQLFVIRNLGNIIPPFKESMNKEYLSTISAIEYAICVLKVENIIVCGHSNCGACRIIYDEKSISNLPYTKNWIKLLDSTKEKVMFLNPDSNIKKIWLTELLNIQQQLYNLMTYSFIENRFNSSQLNIYGWYYVINTGEIFNYNFLKREFKLLNKYHNVEL